MVTFPVDDVTPVTDALHAVGKAFAEHRPLVLSPDAVWLTIARGASRMETMRLSALETSRD